MTNCAVRHLSVWRLAISVLVVIMLPSCSEAEQSDTRQQAASEPIQVAQAGPGAAASGTGGGGGKPNILVIMGDDIGIPNISAYSHGLMGYQTTNIDQLAEEGAMFTDYYGEQSCTAGRAAFITGQSPFRVGLTKVGMPGAKQGISDSMRT